MLSSTASYYRDDLTWCIQRAKPLGHWQNIFLFTKDQELWYIGSATFVICVFVSYALLQYENEDYDLFSSGVIIYLALIGLPSFHRPSNTSNRAIFCFLQLSSLILNTFFRSFLIIVLTHSNVGRQLASISGLIENSFVLTGGHYALSKIKEQNMVIF